MEPPENVYSSIDRDTKVDENIKVQNTGHGEVNNETIESNGIHFKKASASDQRQDEIRKQIETI